ncbi:MAG: hypothetical protein JW959_13020 [Pirellulales bacterium]|nr:hypothetical protein [Pirellulales bacterium]
MTTKSLEDVWRWKEEIAKEIDGMSSQERIAYFRQAERRLVEKTGGGKLNLRRLVRTPRQR